VEGGNNNDWSRWEQSPDRIEFLKNRGEDPLNFVSGRACDSWNRWKEDIDLVKKLNQNTYRFSVEWSRIEPEEGKFDKNILQHYLDMVKYCKGQGIEPFVTLWHFTNPVWLADKGGWLNPNSVDYFVRFINVVVDNLKGDVKYWATFNEATTVYAGFSYLKGLWPPQKKSIFKFLKVRRNIIRAHTLTYRRIHEIYDELASIPDQDSTSHNVMAGVVESLTYVVHGRRPDQAVMGRVYGYLRNYSGLSKMAPYSDFIGLNYYHAERRFGGTPKISEKGLTIQDPYWELIAEGIYDCLKGLAGYGKPIFITENGLPDSEDKYRARLIEDHLFWVHKAIEDGVDVRGYIHWSLLDNFEWSSGFGPRFGLVEVDYKTFERRIRPSAFEYAKIIRENQLEISD
jgi:beta-glucosidase